MSVSSQQQSVDGGPEIETEDGAPSPDELFHVLRNQRRRFTIHYLKQANGPVDVGELATQVAAWENEVAVDAVTSKQRRRVYNALQQTHIDELDETGLVEVNRREVSLTERARDLDVYLDIVPGKDIPWSEYYLALGAVSTAAIIVTWLNIGLFAAVPDSAMGICLAVTLLVSGAVNYYDQHQNRLGDQEKPPELRNTE